jgi:hypothetical protein
MEKYDRSPEYQSANNQNQILKGEIDTVSWLIAKRKNKREMCAQR